MFGLTQYEQNKHTLSRFVPREIADIILRLKTDAETEDARDFYYQQMSVFNMDNYYHWHAYDTFLTEINECIKILNTPNFWEMVTFDRRGYVSGTKFIETYSDKSSLSDLDSSYSKRLTALALWGGTSNLSKVSKISPTYKDGLHKIDLLNREFFTIHSLWTQHQQYPHHNICLQFISEWIVARGVIRKRWVLYN